MAAMNDPPSQGQYAGWAPLTGPAAHPPAPSRTVWWVIAISLAVIAACLVVRLDERLTPSASAQSLAGAGARGVFSFPGQMTKSTYGVYMVDVDTGTIWCYEYTAAKRKLRLAAARSWRFDRYLETYNCEDLSPGDVEQLVDQERTAKLQASGAATSP
jgi:hypothetical protein